MYFSGNTHNNKKPLKCEEYSEHYWILWRMTTTYFEVVYMTNSMKQVPNLLENRKMTNHFICVANLALESFQPIRLPFIYATSMFPQLIWNIFNQLIRHIRSRVCFTHCNIFFSTWFATCARPCPAGGASWTWGPPWRWSRRSSKRGGRICGSKKPEIENFWWGSFC